MFCNNCGKEIEDGSEFCIHCGHRVETVRAPIGQQGGMVGEMIDDMRSDETVVLRDPVPRQTAVGQGATPRKRLPAPVLAALLASLVFCGAGLGFFVMSQSNRTAPAENTTHDESASAEAEGEGEFDASSEDSSEESARSTEPEIQQDEAAPAAVVYTVPDLRGYTQDDAIRRINDAGLHVADISYVETTDVSEGCVVSQVPDAGTTLSSADGVSFVVAKAPEVRPHTYEVITQAMTWSEANSYCISHGGHLVTITSQEEYDQVVGLVRGYSQQVFWIGAYRTGDDFAWVTGESFSYTAWASGEPNNDQDIENYAAIFSLTDGTIGWYDVPDDLSPYYKTSKLAFIMEVE